VFTTKCAHSFVPGQRRPPLDVNNIRARAVTASALRAGSYEPVGQDVAGRHDGFVRGPHGAGGGGDWRICRRGGAGTVQRIVTVGLNWNRLLSTRRVAPANQMLRCGLLPCFHAAVRRMELFG